MIKTEIKALEINDIQGLFYLQWLDDEDTLKKGDSYGNQPANGAVLPKF